MAGPGRHGWWTVRLCWVAFLVVVLSPKEASGLGELVGNVFKALKDLPELGRALKTAAKSVLQPVFQPRVARSRDGGGTNDGVPETFCFGEIGCFSNHKDFFHPIHRPINTSPASREEVQVTFRITSREDPFGVLVRGLDVKEALRSSFKPFRKTKVVIHGYLNGRDMPFMEEIPRSFIRHYDVNVVWVDWTDGSIALYNRAVANSRLVGLEIAHFVNWLKNNMGLNPEDVHLIGHSLGAHICGYAGERIPGLGRITGLDPAEPFFQYLPASVRLDPSDAKLVDVIHTDSDSIFSIGQGFGLRQPIGHLDFYPNDGRRQPGCKSPLAAPLRWLTKGFNFSKVWHAVEDALGCNHMRAAVLFVDSIKTSCPYTAFRCNSYEQYKAGDCVTCGADGSGCAPMGLHADAWSGTGSGQQELQLYVSTGSAPHFCRYHYQVAVELGELPGTGWDRMGKLYVVLLSQNGREMIFDLTSGRPKMFSSRGQYKFFLEHSEELGNYQEALVKWVMSSRPSQSPHASLTLKKLVVRNVDTHFNRNRSGRFIGSPSQLSFCDDHGRDIVVNNQAIVKVKASGNCLTTTRRL